MATQAQRDMNRLRVLLDIEAMLEAIAMKALTANIFDGGPTRVAINWTALTPAVPTTKLDELYNRMRVHDRLVFGSLGAQLPAEASLATIRAYVERLVSDLSNGGDVANIQAQLTLALQRITALEGA